MTFPQQQWPPAPAPQQYAPPAAPPQFAQQPQGFPPPAQPDQQWAGQQPAEPQSDGDTSGFFGGGTFISFKEAMWRGVPRGGLVQGKVMRNQTTPGGTIKTWDDGSPRKELLVTLQTAERVDPDDDGQRNLPINGDKVRAVREALKTAGVRDLEIGGWLYVAWTGDKPTTKGNPQKLFTALYARAGQPDPMNGQAPQPAAAPAPPPAPMAQAGVQTHADPAVAAAQQVAWQAAQQQQGAVPPGPPTQQPAAQPTGFNPFAAQGQQAPAQPQQPPAQFNPFAAQG